MATKIKYKLTYLNEDGTEWDLITSFPNQIALNDFIDNGGKFGKLPINVEVL